jgi:hypothetical protein
MLVGAPQAAVRYISSRLSPARRITLKRGPHVRKISRHEEYFRVAAIRAKSQSDASQNGFLPTPGGSGAEANGSPWLTHKAAVGITLYLSTTQGPRAAIHQSSGRRRVVPCRRPVQRAQA